MPHLHRSALMLGLLLAAAHVFAAPRFAHLSVEQGLSQGTVQAILQDRRGFMWFGTEEGLNRFDGYSFAVFKHDPGNPRSLPRDTVSVLWEDRAQRLWVGTWAGLSVFDRRSESFTSIDAIHSRVTAIAEAHDEAGTLWIGTNGEGLIALDPNTGRHTQYTTSATDPASLASNTVSALAIDGKGQLWIGLFSAGVDRLLDPGRFRHYRGLTHDRVYGLATDRRDNVWIATYGGGLHVLDGANETVRHYRASSSGLGSDLVTSVLIDGGGHAWVGTDGAGIRRYDAASDRFVGFVHDTTDPFSLSRDVVRTLYEDHWGQLWTGTFLGGANLLEKGNAFAYFTHSGADASSLGDPVVSSFLEDHRGRVWVGTANGFLHLFNRESGTFVRYRLSGEASGSAILALHEDDAGRLWVGTYGGHLGVFDPGRGTFELRGKHEEVWAITGGPEDSLWLATERTLESLRPTTRASQVCGTAQTPTGRALLRDHEGRFFIGTQEGLYYLPPGSTRVMPFPNAAGEPRVPGSDDIMSLHEDREGQVWIGTRGGGLRRLDPRTGALATFRDFPSNVIYSIEEDSAGKLWLGTNQGLSRFDPVSLAVTSFDLTHGLRGLPFTRGASLRTRDGHLLFGTASGFYDFDPAAQAPATDAPPIALTAFRFLNRPAPFPTTPSTEDPIELSYDDRTFSLEFAALDRAVPRRNRYAYRMRGLGDDWIQLGDKRQVTFANLAPRSYLFEVRTTNSDGVWSPSPGATIRIRVRPPFWMTWWFRVLSVALLAAALLGAHRIRVRSLEADIEQRKRAEEDLRRAKEKYRSIFDNAVEGIYQSTREGRFLTVNPALAHMLGYASPEDLVTSVVDIEKQLCVEPGAQREMMRLLEEEGAVQGFELDLWRRDGTTLRVRATARLVRDPEGNVHYEGTCEDISHRRRAQELQESLLRAESMAAMGALVAGVAHEARNPLFSLSANLDVLDTEIMKQQPCGETLGIVRSELSRLRKLMEDLLEYGRPFRVQRAEERLHDVLAEAARACALHAKERGVTIANHVPDDLPRVWVDRPRLAQALQNLLENGIQHTPPGGVVTATAVALVRSGQPWVECVIADSGPGIAAFDLPLLFQPFFTRRRGGTGLGLSIAQRFVAAHGGVIVAETSDAGARMVIRLPLDGPREDATA